MAASRRPFTSLHGSMCETQSGRVSEAQRWNCRSGPWCCPSSLSDREEEKGWAYARAYALRVELHAVLSHLPSNKAFETFLDYERRVLPIMDEALSAMGARRLRREAFLSYQSKDRALDKIWAYARAYALSEDLRREVGAIAIAASGPSGFRKWRQGLHNRLRLCSGTTSPTAASIDLCLECSRFPHQRIQHLQVLQFLRKRDARDLQDTEQGRGVEGICPGICPGSRF